MTSIRITPAAAEVVGRIRAERRGTLTFTIDGGCCEGTAPHLLEDAVLAPSASPAGEVAGIPVFLQSAMQGPLADARLAIDVREDAMSDSMSLETAYGLRFVLREDR